MVKQLCEGSFRNGILYYGGRGESDDTSSRFKEKTSEEDIIFIKLLYMTGLRVSEAISVTPSKLVAINGGWAVDIIGKRKKRRLVAIPEHLVNELRAYAYEKQLKLEDKFFPVTRSQAFRIVQKAGEQAGINKKVYPHLLRHTAAVERLKRTGNPKSLQYHLGHSSPVMTMRYLNTLQQEEALKIQQEVEFKDI
ncbi:site-specific integrase [bacterium]|nr:site-specific integrase [bacterium]